MFEYMVGSLVFLWLSQRKAKRPSSPTTTVAHQPAITAPSVSPLTDLGTSFVSRSVATK